MEKPKLKDIITISDLLIIAILILLIYQLNEIDKTPEGKTKICFLIDENSEYAKTIETLKNTGGYNANPFTNETTNGRLQLPKNITWTN